MQRVAPFTRPAVNDRNSRNMNVQTKNNDAGINTDSPAFQLAKRIRAEQGVEQVKKFIAAIEPFVAEEERKTISQRFGINFDDIKSISNNVNQSENKPDTSNNNGLDMQKMMMLLSTMMGGAGKTPDIMTLMSLMNNK